MVTEGDWERWEPEDFIPHIDVILEAFGPDRSMIGSDWPVCTCAGEYARVIGVVTDYVERLSPTERELIIGETCAAFYSLDVSQS